MFGPILRRARPRLPRDRVEEGGPPNAYSNVKRMGWAQYDLEAMTSRPHGTNGGVS